MKVSEMKRYPFNAHQNAHHIELYRNVLYCKVLDDEATTEEEALFHRLTDLICTIQSTTRDGRISFLLGNEIGLAKEAILWADNYRAERNNHEVRFTR